MFLLRKFVAAQISVGSAVSHSAEALDRTLRLPRHGRRHPAEAGMSITEYVLMFAGVMLFLGSLVIKFFFPTLTNTLQTLMQNGINVLQST